MPIANTLKKNVPAFQFKFVAVPGDPKAQEDIQLGRLRRIFPNVKFVGVKIIDGSTSDIVKTQMAVEISQPYSTGLRTKLNSGILIKEDGDWLVEQDLGNGGRLISISDEKAQSGDF